MFDRVANIRLVVFIVVCFPVRYAFAQEGWPSPEVGQMYQHARADVKRGNLKAAIVTYRQAIKLAPDKTILYRDLGEALYLNGEQAAAEQALTDAIAKPDADAACYKWLAASKELQQDNKGAKTTLYAGMSRFPTAGELYEELGNEYNTEHKYPQALAAWVTGIEKDRDYAGNYYNAAKEYLNTSTPIWGLLYGETYLYIIHDTINDDQMKKELFAGYKTMFENIAMVKKAKKGEQKGEGFADAVMKVYEQLTPVVSDGITTESLTMVRTRFIMDWYTTYVKKYPFLLFAYQDELIRNGRFDICNQWLFGKAENENQFKAWNRFHEGDISRYIQWQNKNRPRNIAASNYNIDADISVK